ncbi:MAG TPA: YhjD/YihY/BrkB family envelope integrity protein [Jatrophihabitans sp.]|nr:YhjD/YihY/BrkB family envelope integrity protein [Jatrophihabitans sp.]
MVERTDDRPGLVGRARARWQRLRQRRPGVDHLATGYQHYQDRHGNQLAAAITYFSFLALFPLILLGVSITGFVLAAAPHLQTELFAHLTEQVPGSFGKTLKDVISAAIRQRTAVGVVGLAGVALTGLGWIDNLRTGIDTLWGLPPRKRSFLAKKAADALVLAGLGIGMLASLAITVGGTAASGWVLRLIGADRVTGAGTLTSIVALLLAVAGSMVIFGWVMIRLPDTQVSRRTAWRSTLLAAVGFEVLKIVGTFYIARVTKSPAAAVIGPALGVLVWINLVSRYLLFCVAWAATAPDSERLPNPADLPVVGPPVGSAAVDRASGAAPTDRPAGAAPAGVLSPAGVAAGLLSAGAALGAGALALRRSRRSRATTHPRSRH